MPGLGEDDAAPAWPPSLSKYFLRRLIRRSLVTQTEFKEMAHQIVEDMKEKPDDFPFDGEPPNFLENVEALTRLIHLCDQKLNLLGLKSLKTSSDISGRAFYVIVNVTVFDQDMKGSAEIFKPEAKNFFQKLLQVIFDPSNPSHFLTKAGALDLAQSAGLKSRLEGDKALTIFAQELYLEVFNGDYYPGPRLKAEYGPALARLYPDSVGHCGVCHKYSLCHSAACPACSTIHHLNCLLKLTGSNELAALRECKCVKCSNPLEVHLEVILNGSVQRVSDRNHGDQGEAMAIDVDE